MTSDQWTSTGSVDNYVGSQSLDHWSMDNHGRLPTTALATVGSMDNSRQLPTTSDQWTSTGSMDNDIGSQSLGQLVTDDSRQLPTTARSVSLSLSVPLSVHCRSDESGSSMDCTGESLELQSLGQRTTGAGRQQPTTATLTRTQGTSMEDSQAALLPLDQRFTDKDCQLPTTARSQSLDRRFGGKDEQLPMTAPHLWSMVKAPRSDNNCMPLDQRFTVVADHSSAPAALRSTSSVGSVNHVQDGQSLVTAGQVPSSVTATSGLRQARSAVTGLQDCNGNQAPSSHGTRTTNVCRWTSEQLLHSSMETSAGAQLWITDKASTTVMDASTRGGDTLAGVEQNIGSTEPRIATLRWPVDLNESDRPASLNGDLFGQRSSSPAASATGGSSARHPRTEGPADRKLVGGGSQMDCGSGKEDSVICSEHLVNRFSFLLAFFSKFVPKRTVF